MKKKQTQITQVTYNVCADVVAWIASIAVVYLARRGLVTAYNSIDR